MNGDKGKPVLALFYSVASAPGAGLVGYAAVLAYLKTKWSGRWPGLQQFIDYCLDRRCETQIGDLALYGALIVAFDVFVLGFLYVNSRVDEVQAKLAGSRAIDLAWSGSGVLLVVGGIASKSYGVAAVGFFIALGARVVFKLQQKSIIENSPIQAPTKRTVIGSIAEALLIFVGEASDDASQQKAGANMMSFHNAILEDKENVDRVIDYAAASINSANKPLEAAFFDAVDFLLTNEDANARDVSQKIIKFMQDNADEGQRKLLRKSGINRQTSTTSFPVPDISQQPEGAP